MNSNRIKSKLKAFYVFFPIITMLSMNFCTAKQKNKESANDYSYTQVSPNFNADSAFIFIQNQVDFGPRIPASEAHELCGNYLIGKLEEFGANTMEQNFVMKAFDGTNLKGRNIIGSYNLENKDRILLFAHWDSRPFADSEIDKEKRNKPIDGANDGASGVGVLLEIARQINREAPNVGIDIIFFDIEDYGPPSFNKNNPDGDWWCLGSQYWGKNPHVKDYKAKFGILLDMVGGENASFYKEYFSNYYAPNVLENIWKTARQLGYKKYFKSDKVGAIVDDHLFVNQLRNIPSINIIDLKKNDSTFPEYWHTHKDNMKNINKESLKAAGQTVLEVIYNENSNGDK